MIYLVHGEDLTYSRKIIANQQKKLGISKRTEVTPSNVTPAELQDLTNSSNLFGEVAFIVFDISSAGRTNLEPYAEILEKVPNDVTLIILASKELPKSNPILKKVVELGVKPLVNSKTHNANIFKFVDTVFSGNRNASYKELSKLLEEDNDLFYIFSMLLYGLRKNKNKFKESSLRNLFNEIYAIEKGVKTGGISTDIFIPYTMEKIFYAQIQTV